MAISARLGARFRAPGAWITQGTTFQISVSARAIAARSRKRRRLRAVPVGLSRDTKPVRSILGLGLPRRTSSRASVPPSKGSKSGTRPCSAGARPDGSAAACAAARQRAAPAPRGRPGSRPRSSGAAAETRPTTPRSRRDDSRPPGWTNQMFMQSTVCRPSCRRRRSRTRNAAAARQELLGGKYWATTCSRASISAASPSCGRSTAWSRASRGRGAGPRRARVERRRHAQRRAGRARGRGRPGHQRRALRRHAGRAAGVRLPVQRRWPRRSTPTAPPGTSTW